MQVLKLTFDFKVLNVTQTGVISLLYLLMNRRYKVVSYITQSYYLSAPPLNFTSVFKRRSLQTLSHLSLVCERKRVRREK